MEQLLEFVGNHPLLVTAAVVIGAMLLYNEIRLAGTAQFAVSPDQAVRLMNKGALVLDLRDADAYSAGHLSGARLFDAGKLEEQIGAIARYKSKPVIAYDDRGPQAARVAASLRKHEFEHVFALRGGVQAWREEQLPLDRDTDHEKVKRAKA